ncbi:unnamed protein product, partial [marine sediment metagenome]
KYKKDYSYPAQETALSNMEKYQRLKISRATLNRWMRVINDSKYLIRRRRIKRDPRYGLMFKSTLYKITIKGYRLLQAFGVDVSKEIAAYERWLEEINPDRKEKRLKKERAAAKYNPKTPELVKKILNGFGKTFSLVF